MSPPASPMAVATRPSEPGTSGSSTRNRYGIAVSPFQAKVLTVTMSWVPFLWVSRMSLRETASQRERGDDFVPWPLARPLAEVGGHQRDLLRGPHRATVGVQDPHPAGP